MPKPPIDTLSSLRTRVIPKTFDFGGLTLSLEKAAAKARDGSSEHEKRQFVPNKRTSFLERLASRPPVVSSSSGNGLEVSPVDDRDRSSRPTQYSTRRSAGNGERTTPSERSQRGGVDRVQSGPAVGTQNSRPETERREIERTREVPNRFSGLMDSSRQRLTLPDIARKTNARPASEYVREIASLDKLAAEAGLAPRPASMSASSSAGSASMQQGNRGYKGRLEGRPQASSPGNTRFSVAAVSRGQGGVGGRPRRAGGPGASAAGGQKGKSGGREPRQKTRAQENEDARRQAVLARKNAERPQPVPYNFDGIDAASLSPVLNRLRDAGSMSTYSHFNSLARDQRDAARLVVSNRSIVQKSRVLDKIGAWIPPSARTSETSTNGPSYEYVS